MTLLILATLFLTVVRPMRRAASSVSSSHNLSSAHEALAAGRFAEARDFAQASLDARSGQLESQLVLLRAQDALQDPARSALASSILDHPGLQSTERAEAFRVLARRAAMAVVESRWSGFAELREDPALLAPYADRLLAEGKPDQALRLLQNPGSDSPADSPLHRVQLRLLRHQGDPTSWHAAQKLLVAAAQLARKEGRLLDDELLTIWEEVPAEVVDPATADSIPSDGSPRLRCLQRKLHQGNRALDPADPEIAAWIAAKDPGARLPLAKLLHACGQPHKAHALFAGKPPATIAEYEWMRAVRTQAGEWEAWLAYLQGKITTEIPQALIQSDRALTCARVGDDATSLAAWRLAVSFATGRGHNVTLLSLARQVEPVLPERAFEARLLAIRRGEESLPLFSDLAPLLAHLRATGKQAELLDVLKAYRTIEPSNPDPQEQLAYLGLLASELSPAQARELSEPLIGTPGTGQLAPVVMVVAALLDEAPAQARAWITKTKLRERGDLPPVQRWIIHHAEDPSTADQAVPLDMTHILPGERALVERLRTRSKAASQLNLDPGEDSTAPE